jgi:Family of unknown function (DUF5906)
MELVERPDLYAVKFLNSITFECFKQDCMNEAEINGEKKPTLKDIKTWYTILKDFCKTNLKTKGITKRIYAYSQNTPAGLGGRLFSSGSLQSIWGVYRGLLMRDIGTDIDMANAHPVILRYVCKKHNIKCPNLEYYINNRDECLAEFNTRNAGKTAYLVSTNSDKNCYSKSPEQLKQYDKEMKAIQKKLVELPDYKKLQDTIPQDKRTDNYNGSVINRILCYYENIILQHAVHFINQKGIEIAILMFDGLMVYGNYYENLQLLQELEDYVESQMIGLNMKWAYKAHDNTLEIPKDFVVVDKLGYVEVKDNFEKLVCKILDKSTFICEINNSKIVKSKTQLITTYENLGYYDDEGNHSYFINNWLKDPQMLTYDSIGMYPNPKLCPKNIYNMWEAFEIEKYKSPYDKNLPALNMFLKHIQILCNNEKPVYDYLTKWIAQMIQYPETKTIMPTIISAEGSGKGTLVNLIRKLLGDRKVFETSSPSRDIWGEFNTHMANSFFINLDELSKRECADSEGRIKALITNPALTINDKGVPSYQITSYHRFMSTTNNREPINTKNGDRRNLIILASDELKGNYDYFQKINEYMNDINALRTFYDYLKSIPDMDKFGSIPIPETSYQEEQKKANREPIDIWLEDIVTDMFNNNIKEKKFDNVQLITSFENWKHINSVSYEINAIKLSCRIMNMKLEGITNHNSAGRFKRFDIDKLAKHYGLGCRIDITEEEDDETD